MIETGLVYIYSVLPTREFVGCGALVEGGYVATCRHVWRDAIASESEEIGEPSEVEIEFPFARDQGVARSRSDEWGRTIAGKELGDVQVAQGDSVSALKFYSDSLAIIDRLAKSDPRNAGWQHDLSVSYEKVGNVQAEQGNLVGALKSYRDGLAIRYRLAKADPGNPGWQRDLSVSHEKVGDVQRAQGDPDIR